MDNNKLDKIIKPITNPIHKSDLIFTMIDHAIEKFKEEYGGFDLTPDFQRGHVWVYDQKKLYIENILKGVVTPGGLTIQFNCPNFELDKSSDSDLPDGFQCIDGLQRLTAIQEYIKGQVFPFGLHLEDLRGSKYDIRSVKYGISIAVYDFQYKKDLLEHYITLNAGGTPHSKEEIDRVRNMINELKNEGQHQGLNP
jgi:hypothetical protein